MVFDFSQFPEKGRIHRLTLRKVRQPLVEEGLFENVKGILVGVSGGVDSGVLLHMMCSLQKEWGYEIHAAHVHHGTRGAESDRDATVAQEVARKHGVPFSLLKLNSKKGVATAEHLLREKRLALLERCAKKVGADRIALGHHLDDQAETLLLRLLSGTDVRGLGGIRPYRPPYWVRPLLQLTRAEILKEAVGCHIPYIEDSSNLLTHARRNFLRKNVVPILKTHFNPQLHHHLAELASSFSKVSDFLEVEAEKTLKKALRREGRVWVSPLRKSPEVVRTAALQEAYRRIAGSAKALRREQMKAVNHLVMTDGGERTYSLPGGVIAERHRDWIRFSRHSR